MYYFVLSEKMILANWDDIRADPDNSRQDVDTPDEWIALAKAGEIKFAGATVCIHNHLPSTIPARTRDRFK